MDKFLNSIWAKILRILLPASAMVMGAVKGSYDTVKQISSVTDTDLGEYAEAPYSHYYDFQGTGLLGWAPFLCMIACGLSVVLAIVCLRHETEKNLTALAGTLCVAVVINMLIMCIMPVTLMASLICTVLLLAILITAAQEMKMENAKKK